mmetsp:Transcript_1432/g.2507  ORF Transcript_1432/g.2507 Transcript_1432/m.2507 type:complete len:228 (-) Transcript_1432:44-727(-)
MGNAPVQSAHHDDETIIRYNTFGCCCSGPHYPPNKILVCSEAEYDRIKRIALPLGDTVWFKADFCGTPCCPSPYDPDQAKGKEMLRELHTAFPHLSFRITAYWVGRGDSAHWQHALSIKKKTHTGGGPNQGSQLQVPESQAMNRVQPMEAPTFQFAEQMQPMQQQMQPMQMMQPMQPMQMQMQPMQMQPMGWQPTGMGMPNAPPSYMQTQIPVAAAVVNDTTYKPQF